MSNRIVNCTDREVRLSREGRPPLILSAAAVPAELVPLRRRAIDAPQGVSMTCAGATRAVGLPPPAEGVVYLVEPAIAIALAAERWDIACLDDGALLRWDASPDAVPAR